jgi:hypothetical protein
VAAALRQKTGCASTERCQWSPWMHWAKPRCGTRS